MKLQFKLILAFQFLLWNATSLFAQADAGTVQSKI